MAGTGAFMIDPVLLNGETGGRLEAPNHDPVTTTTNALKPAVDEKGRILTSREDFRAILESIRRKQPLQDTLACIKEIDSVPQSWGLERLRNDILNHWYSDAPLSPATSSRPSVGQVDLPIDALAAFGAGDIDDDETSLVNEYGAGIHGADAHELLAYGDDDDEDNDEILMGGEDDDGNVPGDGTSYKAFQTKIRIDAVRRAEGNRRAGGLRTQKAMVRLWEEFVINALAEQTICDRIVDEHSLLLFIKYCSERPKRTRRGVEIPGTFVGASQLKKLFFGVLRIRKEQDAADPALARTRPATSVIVWDEIKTRMDIALKRARSGLVPGEDAPDITANTFLAEVTDEQLKAVMKGFLMHRELRSTVYGFLAWTTQNASGNRGDDLRALKLAELQPWVMLHPNKQTAIPAALGLQGEEKAGKRGMRTVINPVYTVWIAHRNPEQCPMGAFAFFHHFLHDSQNISAKLDINWSVNNSWRQVRVLSGPKSPTTPFSDQSLYNLYTRAFDKAKFTSRIKAHLPRHLLGFKQEAMGVDPNDTSQLGWVRGETYFDTYRPAIPKSAVLGAHGYKTHEVYDPVWRHVHVPEQFLQLMCPNAEEIYESIVGKANLTGAANYWKMIIELRPYLFQCGAAIFEICPTSALFRLPAFQNQDVRNWMTTSFRSELCALRAGEGSPIDLQRLENELLQRSLEDLRSLAAAQHAELKQLRLLLERRTAVMSPTQGFSMKQYHATAISHTTDANPSPAEPDTDISQHVRNLSGIYRADDATLRAFVNESPRTPGVPRASTQVDLVIPPVAAFCKEDAPRTIWQPLLGQKSVRWPDVFAKIEQPHLLWEVWKPSKTLDQYESVEDLWNIYTLGEPKYDSNGTQTGIGPPLHLVEQHFHFRWRNKGPTSQKKSWQRFREIPEWIDSQAQARQVSPQIIIQELEAMRCEGNKGLKGLNQLSRDVENLRKSSARLLLPSEPQVAPDSSSSRLGSPFNESQQVSSLAHSQSKRKRARAIGARKRAKI